MVNWHSTLRSCFCRYWLQSNKLGVWTWKKYTFSAFSNSALTKKPSQMNYCVAATNRSTPVCFPSICNATCIYLTCFLGLWQWNWSLFCVGWKKKTDDKCTWCTCLKKKKHGPLISNHQNCTTKPKFKNFSSYAAKTDYFTFVFP